MPKKTKDIAILKKKDDDFEENMDPEQRRLE